MCGTVKYEFDLFGESDVNSDAFQETGYYFGYHHGAEIREKFLKDYPHSCMTSTPNEFSSVQGREAAVPNGVRDHGSFGAECDAAWRSSLPL